MRSSQVPTFLSILNSWIMTDTKIALKMRTSVEGIVKNNHALQNKVLFYSKSWDEMYSDLKKKKKEIVQWIQCEECAF